MALDLRAVAVNTASVTVDYMGQSAVLKYKPSAITQDALERTEEDEGFVEFFADCVTEWDVTSGDEPVSIDAKTLKSLPLVFLRACFLTIMRDGGQGDPAKPSSDG